MNKNFIIVMILSAALIILSPLAYCQSNTKLENYLEKLPHQLKLDEKTPQKYLMVSTCIDYDLFGNFIKKMRITGECILLKNGYVKWKNVTISHSQSLNDSFPEEAKQNYMEDFTYNPSLDDVLNDTFFNKIPEADIAVKSLIWDLTMFEAFAWYKWDSLKLNNEFSAKEINTNVKITGVGVLENKNVQITWTGITKTNNKICAVIKYIAMNNPFEMNYQNIMFKGRSHYWGNIYVSLSDKQIEYAELYEDVLLDGKMKGQESVYKANTVRNITLQKIL